MTRVDILLEEALEGWRGVRDGVEAEVENVPSAQFAFRPAPEVRTVTELVQHILEVAMMMTGELTRPDTNLHRAPWPRLLGLYAKPAWRTRGKAPPVRLLQSQHRRAEAQFRSEGRHERLPPRHDRGQRSIRFRLTVGVRRSARVGRGPCSGAANLLTSLSVVARILRSKARTTGGCA
jgi:hypothetical protein